MAHSMQVGKRDSTRVASEPPLVMKKDDVKDTLLDGGAARPTRLPYSDERSDWSLPWLDRAACFEAGLSVDDYFVSAGYAISDEAINVCRGCPVRLDCLEHAYSLGIFSGYSGGMSPGQRRKMTLERAREFIKKDGVRPVRNLPVRRNGKRAVREY
jgi:hypothetical protein